MTLGNAAFAAVYTRATSLLPRDGFDFDKVKPNGDAVPKSGIIYDLLSALMFLGIASALGGFIAGVIAFTAGPIFGAHFLTDRGKAMMWKAGGGAFLLGSATSLISWLLAK